MSRRAQDHPAKNWPPSTADGPLAVLVSGGLDSAIMLGEAVNAYPAIHPLYIRTGLNWEAVEHDYLSRFLAAVAGSTLRPLHVLRQPVEDLYGPHWSLTGECVPNEASPDEAVYLPGRNVLLLAKSILWCHLNDVPELALAPLGSNPFADATPEFFESYAASVNRAVRGNVRIIRPYASLDKTAVLLRGRNLPLGLTFSCIKPVAALHCGRCNKCAERKAGFRDAGLADPTAYAAAPG